MIRLDPSSPIPLYHQLAEALRYRIATGTITEGDALPSLRSGAALWKVHLHTVRRAYAELAEQGLVRTSAPHGTVVLGAGDGRSRHSAVDRFLTRVIGEAKTEFGLSPEELRQRLADHRTPDGGAVPTVHVIECSETQAVDLARQMEAAWQVNARGWSLERPGEPPTGPMVATYFHYHEIRTRWPERLDDIRFVRLRLDPLLAGRLPERGPREARTDVLLCEREWSIATDMATDVLTVLPPARYNLELFVSDSAQAALAAPQAEGKAVLFSPRMWGALPSAERADPRAVELRYLFEAEDLLALAEELHWRSCSLTPAHP